MATKHVSFVEAIRLHGVFNLRHNFEPHINIIYGQNGGGKTTLLHILANALAGEYERFVFLQFETIKIGFSDGKVLQLNRTHDDEKEVNLNAFVNDVPIAGFRAIFASDSDPRPRTKLFPRRRPSETEIRTLKPVYHISYFPAFRSMLDAWVAASRDGTFRPSYVQRTPTDFARKLFGQFVPQLTYPSLIDIEGKLREEVRRAFRLVSEAETAQMGQAADTVFQEILAEPRAGHRPIGELVEKITSLCSRIKHVSDLLGRKPGTDLSRLGRLVGDPGQIAALIGHARSILEIYEKALERVAIAQEEAILELKLYLKTINSFFSLGEKKLIIARDEDVRIWHEKVGRDLSLQTLSSGERQIVAMMYEATHMSDKEVVLIDEPELSLHVDWQRPLISRMAEQMSEKQIIVTTHSPVIGSDIGQLQELNLTYAQNPLPQEDHLALHTEVRIWPSKEEEKPT